MIIRPLYYLLPALLCAIPAVLSADEPPGLAGHWKLDGDARDAITPGHGLTA